MIIVKWSLYKYKFKLLIEVGTNLIIDGNLSLRVDWWCSHLCGWLMSSWGRLFEYGLVLYKRNYKLFAASAASLSSASSLSCSAWALTVNKTNCAFSWKIERFLCGDHQPRRIDWIQEFLNPPTNSILANCSTTNHRHVHWKKMPVDPTETDHLCKLMNAQTKVKYLQYWKEFVQFFIVSFTKASFFRFLIPFQGADLKGPCYATLLKTDFEVVNDDLKEKNSTYMFFKARRQLGRKQTWAYYFELRRKTFSQLWPTAWKWWWRATKDDNSKSSRVQWGAVNGPLSVRSFSQKAQVCHWHKGHIACEKWKIFFQALPSLHQLQSQ